MNIPEIEKAAKEAGRHTIEIDPSTILSMIEALREARMFVHWQTHGAAVNARIPTIREGRELLAKLESWGI